uniref:Uncharacterized protein n=1 Tax=Glycine max TaxID=3847 RepID=C6T897_SOYBN|nr:unknown [Glycine max]
MIYRSIQVVVFSNKLNLLMPFGPLAILVQKLTGHLGWVFGLSLLGIMPLAERLGYATEQLAFYTGDTVGGSFKCYIWKCNRTDHLNICTEKWSDTRCPALFAGFNFVQYVTGAWVCILMWWDC